MENNEYRSFAEDVVSALVGDYGYDPTLKQREGATIEIKYMVADFVRNKLKETRTGGDKL